MNFHSKHRLSAIIILFLFAMAATTLAKNFCGETYDAAALSCSAECPNGLDSECENGQACFVVDSCDEIQKTPTPSFILVPSPSAEGVTPSPESFDGNSFDYCGFNFENASSCKKPCSAMKELDCGEGETCFSGVSACPSIIPASKRFCGTNWEDSTKCQAECPSGLDSECPENEQCYKSEGCRSECLNEDEDCDSAPSPSSEQPDPETPPKQSSNYCGTNFTDARNCFAPCPDGVDSQCGSNQKCYSNVTDCLDIPDAKNYCGIDMLDSEKCTIECPNGFDMECPEGEKCFKSEGCQPSPTPEPIDQEGRLTVVESVATALAVFASVVALVECLRRFILWRRRKSQTSEDEFIDEDNMEVRHTDAELDHTVTP